MNSPNTGQSKFIDRRAWHEEEVRHAADVYVQIWHQVYMEPVPDKNFQEYADGVYNTYTTLFMGEPPDDALTRKEALRIIGETYIPTQEERDYNLAVARAAYLNMVIDKPGLEKSFPWEKAKGILLDANGNLLI